MEKLRLAVLISGRGSNLGALIDACQDPAFPAEIVAVVANKPDAGGLARAHGAGIPAMIVDSSYFKGDKAGFEDALAHTLQEFKPDLICLAGFMRILSARFLDQFKDRVINIHPSLLPLHKGLDTHERALQAGDKMHGCSVHVVSPGMDEGAVILQSTLNINADDTPESLAARVLTLEHVAYAQVVREIALKHVMIQNGQVIRPNTAKDTNNKTKELPMTHETHEASQEAVQDSNAMWKYFTKISAYAAVFTIVVLVLLALFVA